MKLYNSAIISLLGLLLSVSVFTSCKSDEVDGYIVTSDYVGTQSTVLLNGVTKSKLAISAESAWKIEISDTDKWIQVSDIQGTGTKEIEVNAATPNPSPSQERAGTVTILYTTIGMKQTIAVSQYPGDQTFSVDKAPEMLVGNNAATYPVAINSNAAWSLESGEYSWCTFDKTSASGSDVVNLTIERNETEYSRTATFLFKSDQKEVTLVVTQSATEIIPPDPSLFVNVPENLVNPQNEGGTYMLYVESNTNWTVESSNTEWLQVSTRGANGSADIQVTVAPNNYQASRTAALVFTYADSNGEPRRYERVVTQSGWEQSFSVTPASTAVGYSGGEVNATVITNLAWTLEVSADWLKPSTESGNGGQVVVLSADANRLSSERTATVTFHYSIDGRAEISQVVVRQDGWTQSFAVTPATTTIDNKGGEVKATVDTNLPWALEVSADWLKPSALSGNGGQAVTFTAAANSLSSSRKATVTFHYSIDGRAATSQITVEQKGWSQSFTATPTNTSVSREGGKIAIDVTTNLQWALEVSNDWVKPSEVRGDGNKKLELTVSANTTTSARKATVTFKYSIDGEQKTTVVNVSQEAGLAPDDWDNNTPEYK